MVGQLLRRLAEAEEQVSISSSSQADSRTRMLLRSWPACLPACRQEDVKMLHTGSGRTYMQAAVTTSCCQTQCPTSEQGRIFSCCDCRDVHPAHARSRARRRQTARAATPPQPAAASRWRSPATTRRRRSTATTRTSRCRSPSRTSATRCDGAPHAAKPQLGCSLRSITP